MKFNLKDYKLFSKNDVLGFIKHNLSGCVSWKGYTLTSKPDPKIVYKGEQPLFDFDMFKTKHTKQYKEMLRVYVGDGITMFHFVPDVVGFNKDGNILTFNVKEILKEYKDIL